MIIGNGLLAKKFYNDYNDNNNITIFASGVSDSTETRESEFLREKNTLNKYINERKDAKIIYFSTVMIINNAESKYIKHKIDIENLIQNTAKSYFIIRVPQVLGFGGNKKNIVNDFKNKIIKNETLTIYNNTFRSIIDIDDLFNIATECINKVENKIINFSHIEKITILDLARIIYSILNKKENIKLVNQSYSINSENSDLINNIIEKLNINKNNYTKRCLEKYLLN